MIKPPSFLTSKTVFYIILFAAILRLLGLFDEFDIDEAWTFFRVSELHSRWDIFTHLYMDGHPLSSLFMYCVGKGNPSHWFKFRLMSYVFGVFDVFLTYLISVKLFPSKQWRLIVTLLVAPPSLWLYILVQQWVIH